MQHGRLITMVVGAVTSALLAIIAAETGAHSLAQRLSRDAQAAIAEAGGTGVQADFTTPQGWATRHPVLRGGKQLDEATRLMVARAVARIPGVGAIRWDSAPRAARNGGEPPKPLHCQDDVDALLRTRTFRFEESSVQIASSSSGLISEVAQTLRPCLGSIIAITGHTDSSGNEAGNLALSRDRADAVRQALIRRGIPADGLRAIGKGSSEPVEGLDPADPANRRIEFSVIATASIKPTPVDTPGPW